MPPVAPQRDDLDRVLDAFTRRARAVMDRAEQRIAQSRALRWEMARRDSSISLGARKPSLDDYDQQD